MACPPSAMAMARRAARQASGPGASSPDTVPEALPLGGFARLRARLRLPEDGPQRTALRAIVAGGLLVLLLAVVAQSCATPIAPFQMERYVKLGPRQGPITLQRELLAVHGAPAPLGGLVSQLGRMGFNCPGTLPEETMLCRFRARRQDGQVATFLVEIRHDGAVVQDIAARMELGAR